MIQLDISILVFYYVLFSVIGILIIWLAFGHKPTRRYSAKDSSYIWKCSVCFHKYVDSRNEDMTTCPQCGSYNKREDIK